MTDTIIPDRNSAFEYDRQARETNWLGPEVVFGLVYEYVKPGETLLDLGIGSGLSSIRFHQAGLQDLWLGWLWRCFGRLPRQGVRR
jgi:hypothetical protein